MFRFTITITTFDKRNKYITGWERCKTAKMTDVYFYKSFLPKRLKKVSGGYCYTISKVKVR
jgi:hypothetical protein